ncbi:carbon-nitrogen hydrolase family protein [Desulfofundulus thermosubterraneus]|uniref:Carbon-nitrogen hydrolase n=1 Tax=Desulfofundulus thermosubterraneus DSM 16057 TaxID=1121432 RepID=A0A1M6AGE3_9FIRM|nr:carbon-nitrogen hydrolase family protein [Desulfofundulus thermosubterraneus]SHI35303.1 Carbon-nitrogen hydrolase [Desulfofundulus thermosubterraneus DSM 16057]
MSWVKLAIVQFPRDRTDLDQNIAQMHKFLDEITADVDVVLLPEDWLGATVIDWDDYQEIIVKLFHGAILSRGKSGGYIPDGPHVVGSPSLTPVLVSGAQYVRAEGGIFSRGMILGGELSAPVFFEKQFPSQAIGERKYVKPGTLLPVIRHRGTPLGVVVCVDIMYPEIVRSLALRGALLILNPANIPAARMPLWQSVGITRACENTVFVVAANNTATSYPDGREVQGDSFVAYPDGYTLLSCGREPGVYYFDLDLSRVNKVRQRWPYLEDVRSNRESICRKYYSE